MEVYVLTRHRGDIILNPEVFNNLEDARIALRNRYEDAKCLGNTNEGEISGTGLIAFVSYRTGDTEWFNIFKCGTKSKAHIDFKYKGVTIAQSKTFNSILEVQNIVDGMSVTYNGDDTRKDFEIVIVYEES